MLTSQTFSLAPKPNRCYTALLFGLSFGLARGGIAQPATVVAPATTIAPAKTTKPTAAPTSKLFDAALLLSDLETLSSDAMQGRGTGS